jgi:hypothetical protein
MGGGSHSNNNRSVVVPVMRGGCATHHSLSLFVSIGIVRDSILLRQSCACYLTSQRITLQLNFRTSEVGWIPPSAFNHRLKSEDIKFKIPWIEMLCIHCSLYLADPNPIGKV